jgi:Phosphotransferase enzyme family
MITLSDENVISYLINKGLYPQEDDRSVKITSLSGKNFNLRLQFANGQDWIVKQEAIGQYGHSDDFLGEWAVQSLLRSTADLAALRDFVPTVELYDPENAILVSRFLTGYEDLADYYDRAQTPDCAVAQAIGQTLGNLHRQTFRQSRYRDFLQQIDDRIRTRSHRLAIPRPTPETFGHVRSDALGFFRWLQHHGDVTAAIAHLATTAQSRCLVHQDLRLENWLWCGATGNLRLIDWEQVDWGDPLTDLADVLAAYLTLWLDRCDWDVSSHLPDCLQTAGLPLAALQPSLQMLMRHYYTTFPAIADGQPDWVIRTLGYTGQKLIDRVECVIQYHQPMGPQTAATLQLAARLLCQPERAGMSIWGCDLVAELAGMMVAA